VGPLFNPFYWFLSIIACVVALAIATFAGVLTHHLGTQRRNHSQPVRLFLPIFIATIIGITTFCSLGAWLVRDRSIPLFQPTRESIIGVWEMDAFSLANMANDGGYPISTHTITFQEDNTFEMVNMPDWWLRGSYQSDTGFYSGTGTWQIEKLFGYWVVELKFMTLNGHPESIVSSLHIGDWDGKRSIYYQLSEMSYLVSYKKQ
jgi:hypothetical protein